MSEGLSKQDLDCLVAAILSAPRIDTNSTLNSGRKELTRQGGAAALLNDHAKATPAE